MMRKIFFLTAGLWWMGGGYAQSSFTLMGGFNNSNFYCSQTRAEYPHKFTADNAYLVSFSYRENLSALQKNLQVGAQLEFKQQSAEFYYEDYHYFKDTIATRAKFNIRSLNLYLFPELKVGERVKFVFSGGPVFQYIINVEAKGRQAKVAQPHNIEYDLHDKNSKEISGFNVGAKVNLGVVIPIYRNLYFTFCNSYYAGFTGMQGDLSKRMKYFNCVDINISGGIVYIFNHKNWFEK